MNCQQIEPSHLPFEDLAFLKNVIFEIVVGGKVESVLRSFNWFASGMYKELIWSPPSGDHETKTGKLLLAP